MRISDWSSDVCSSDLTITDADSADAETYAAMIAKYAPDEDIDPDPVVSAGVGAGVSSVIHLVRAMEGLTGDVTAETVLAQMKAAADVPLWMAEGQTFTCDGSTVAIMPTVCSVSFFVGPLTEDGEVENPVAVDATPLFEM